MTYTTGPNRPQGVTPARGITAPRPDTPVVNLRDGHLRHFGRPVVESARAHMPATKRYSIAWLNAKGQAEYAEHAAPDDLGLDDVCAAFARGTLVATASGPVAIEDLQPGDSVRTRDAGMQVVDWIGACTISRGDADDEASRPLRIKADALGDQRPMQDLIVSARFRLLTNHPNCDALFNTPEALAPAADLLDGDTILRVRPAEDLMFYNLMTAKHQVIEVNGLETETYHPGNFGVAVMPLELQAHLRHLLPHLAGDLSRFGRTVRPVLKGFEAEVLRVG